MQVCCIFINQWLQSRDPPEEAQDKEEAFFDRLRCYVCLQLLAAWCAVPAQLRSDGGFGSMRDMPHCAGGVLSKDSVKP